MSKKPKPPVSKQRAALYARVSSEEQAKKETIETQVAEGQRYCEQHGLDLVATFLDRGISGTVPFEARTGGKALLAAADRKEFDLVLVWKVSRLGRQDVVSHVARHSLENRGIGLRSITEPFDTSTPAGQFMFSILSANAAMERDNIRQNIKAGLMRIAANRSHVNGRVPFGYKVSPQKELLPDPAAARTVKRIFTLAAKGMSCPAIAEQLGKEGVRSIHGLPWRPSLLVRLLKKTYYKGEKVWDSKGDCLTTGCPALVTPLLWEKAQQSLSHNRIYKGVKKHQYLLSSLVRCGLCGHIMTGKAKSQTKKGAVLKYYRCSDKARGEMPHCNSRHVPARELENLVFEQVTAWLLDRATLEADIAQAMEAQQHEQQDRLAYLTSLQEQLATCHATKDRYLRLYGQGVVQEADLAPLLTETETQATKLQASIKELEATLSPDLMASRLQVVKDKLYFFQKRLQEGRVSEEFKREILTTCAVQVTVTMPKGEKNKGFVKDAVNVNILPALGESVDLAAAIEKLPRDQIIRPEPLKAAIGLSVLLNTSQH